MFKWIREFFGGKDTTPQTITVPAAEPAPVPEEKIEVKKEIEPWNKFPTSPPPEAEPPKKPRAKRNQSVVKTKPRVKKDANV